MLSVQDPHLTTARTAYERLKELIVTLDLESGATIREAELQERLGVGRTPLREALHRLAQEDMVRIFPRRAIVVAKLGVPEMRQIFETRLILEAEAARLAAQRIAECSLAEIEAMIAEMRAAADAIDVAHYLQVDRSLHRAIAEQAQNRYLSRSIEHLLTLNLWLWHMHFATHPLTPADIFTHDQIVAALANRDGAAAAEATRAHILYAKERLLSGL